MSYLRDTQIFQGVGQAPEPPPPQIVSTSGTPPIFFFSQVFFSPQTAHTPAYIKVMSYLACNFHFWVIKKVIDKKDVELANHFNS